MYVKDNCPNCNISFIGDKIPDDINQPYTSFDGEICYPYGPPEDVYWRKEIGIDGGYIGIYDGIVAFQCPECKHEFPRAETSWSLEMFNKYMKWKVENNDKTK